MEISLYAMNPDCMTSNTAAKQLHQTVGKLEMRPVARRALSLGDIDGGVGLTYRPEVDVTVSMTQRCSAVS